MSCYLVKLEAYWKMMQVSDICFVTKQRTLFSPWKFNFLYYDNNKISLHKRKCVFCVHTPPSIALRKKTGIIKNRHQEVTQKKTNWKLESAMKIAISASIIRSLLKCYSAAAKKHPFIVGYFCAGCIKCVIQFKYAVLCTFLHTLTRLLV